MAIATDPKAVSPEAAATEEVRTDAADGEALIWLPIEGAIAHLKAMGLPYSRATIYRNYARDELDGITHFGVPITDEEPAASDREIADSEVVDDGESHVTMLPHPPSIATQDLASEFAEDRSRLLRMLESQERVIESQARTIEVQQTRLGEGADERAALTAKMMALQAGPKQVTPPIAAASPVAEPTVAEAPQAESVPTPTPEAEPSSVTIRGQAKRWYEFWR
jgi:hypothetical protein